MRYCLRSRQTNEYLQKADEIKVEYRDRRSIPDLAEKYPNKTIILMHTLNDPELEWRDILNYDILTKRRFVLCLSNVEDCKKARVNNIPFYFGYPVTSWDELRMLKHLGVVYVRLGAPLFFELDKVAKLNIPIRIVPNIAYNDGFPREDGVCGTWVRPEDIDAYGEYTDVVEFEDCDLKKEQAMFRLYAEQKAWPGDLGFIITGLNHLGVNRMIDPEMSQKRITCGQRCKEFSACKICYRMLDMADPNLLQEYQEKVLQKDSN